MNIKFKSKSVPIFVDTDTIVEPSELSYDVILSPAFYWVKKESLPVKYLRDVKKLLPSIFDDFLPQGHFSYHAYKKEDDFVLYAYNDKEILERLETIGIKSSQINNLYFAQSELEDMQSAICFEEKALFVKDGLLVQLPSCMLEDSADLDLENHIFSKHSIALARYSHIADNNSIIKISIFVAVFMFIFGVEWFMISSQNSVIEESATEIFAKHHLKSTNFQNEAIFKKLNKTYKTQSKLRKNMGVMLDLKLFDGEYIKEMYFDKKLLTVSLVLKSENRVSSIEKMLKQKHVYYTSSYKNEILTLEIK